MNKNSNSKLTAKDYVEKLSKEEHLITFLGEHEICNAESIDNIEIYTKEDKLGQMIVSVMDVNSYTILIDIKTGEPTIDQVANAVYGRGINCDKRVIMYGGSNRTEIYGPATGEVVVGSLVECMNDYESNLYMVKISDQEYKTELFDLIVNDGNTSSQRRTFNELPTKEQFRKSEFWNVYYDSLNPEYYREWDTFAGGISDNDKHGWYCESSPFRIEVEWNDKGAFFTINQMKGEIDLLMSIWLEKKKELESEFQNLDMQFSIPPNELPKVTIKFWDFPIGCIINARTNEKISYARLLHSRFDDLLSFMEGVAG